MSGKIEFIVKNGASKDPRYPTYPYWLLRIWNHEKTKYVECAPTYNEMKDLMRFWVMHERINDLDRARSADAPKKSDQFKDIISETLQYNVKILRALYEEAKCNGLVCGLSWTQIGEKQNDTAN